MPRPKKQPPSPKPAAAAAPYPAPYVEQYTADSELGPMTPDRMAELMGWCYEGDPRWSKDNVLLKDEDGKKVCCANNAGNRPYDEKRARALAQDILRRNWKFNGESMIISRTGRTLSMQHRGTALLLAEQMRTGPNASFWEEVWGEGPVTIECVVVYGVSDDPEVVRTLDNTMPRTLTDVLYTDSVFSDLRGKERVAACRALEYATARLWKRTGHAASRRTPFMTHSEALEFIGRHERIKRAVKHVLEEARGSKNLEKFTTLGVAAAMLYMMGCSASTSEADAYHHQRREGEASEVGLDWTFWEKACEFWTKLVGGHPELLEVRHAVAALHGVDGTGEGTRAEKEAIVVKAWNHWSAGGKLTKKALELPRKPADEDGYRALDEVRVPGLGGIDLGHPDAEPDAVTVDPDNEGGPEQDDDADPGTPTNDDDDGEEMTPEELQARMAEARAHTQAEEDRKRREEAAKVQQATAAKRRQRLQQQVAASPPHG